MGFLVKGDKVPANVEFSLESDGGDINIMANGVLVAYFDGIDGSLTRCLVGFPDQAKLSGLKFTDKGYIETT